MANEELKERLTNIAMDSWHDGFDAGLEAAIGAVTILKQAHMTQRQEASQ